MKDKISTIQSAIRDNHKRGNIGDFLKENIKPDSKLSIVSAYFTIYAFKHLKDELNSIDKLDFLFGEPTFIKSIDPSKVNKKDFKIEDDKLVIPLESRLQQKSVAKECSDWIKEKVDIKSMVKPNFLHGKMYHIKNNTGVEKAILGSSNFTVNGLGLGGSPNIELNLEVDNDRDRTDLLDWFQEIWNDPTGLVENVKDDVLKYLEQLYVENEPEFIYFKTLYHLFEKYLSEQQSGGFLDEKIGFFDTEIWSFLYDFQRDGVRGAINKILKHDGCIIADSVGLGKTFEALAIIKYFELLNDRVLVLCPKKLRENWAVYKRNDLLNPLIKDRFSYDIICHTDLSRESGDSGGIELSTLNWGNYRLIVIDESHNFRNNAKGKYNEKRDKYVKTRYEKLIEDIIKQGVETKVLLLTATPVNNSLRDLRNQIYLITKERDNALLESTQVRDIGQTIKNAQTQFTLWADPKKNPNRLVKELLEKLDSSFFKLLDELTIARSRKHITSYYNLKKIGGFPERLKPISKAPDIDLKRRFPSYDKLNKDILKYKLSLFSPSAYLKKEFRELYKSRDGESKMSFDDQATREHFLIGMMKVNFLKRLESSIEAFEISMDKTVNKINTIIKTIEEYKDQHIETDLLQYDLFKLPEDIDDEDIDNVNETWEVGKKIKYRLAHIDLDTWLKDLKEDKDQLNSLYNNAQTVTPDRDEKLSVLKELIESKLKKPINADNNKVLIFTAFADTAYYLYDSLETWVRDELGLHIAVVAGGARNNLTTFKPTGYKSHSEFNHILTNFSPVSKQRNKISSMPQNGEIDILIGTDCISEGQNLQDCDCLINYDIHWNPVRIIQRFGRIDRIGSSNKHIQLVNFWPTDDLNNYINLKDRVEARMALVDIAATGEENILSYEENERLINEELKYRNEQLKRLKEEVLDLEDMDDNISLSEFTLDDFRIELSNYLETNKQKLEDAPFGLYAVVPAPSGEHKDITNYSKLDKKAKEIIRPGVIFCLRQKGENKENEKVNPLQPYYLVYIRNDSTVRYNYTNAKGILEIIRALCQGKKEPYDTLCELFNEETRNGIEMEFYNQLLESSIEQISKIFKRRSARNLLSGRDGLLIPKKKQATKTEHFELITWLIIK